VRVSHLGEWGGIRACVSKSQTADEPNYLDQQKQSQENCMLNALLILEDKHVNVNV